MLTMDITCRDFKYGYMDFAIEDIAYRYEESTDKVRKLFAYSFNSLHGKAVRGNLRKAVESVARQVYRQQHIQMAIIQ